MVALTKNQMWLADCCHPPASDKNAKPDIATGIENQKIRFGFCPNNIHAINGTISMERLTMNAPSPSVSLIEIAYIQLINAMVSKHPTKAAERMSCQRVLNNAL